ncbi:GGDEF domain-containing protein [Petroclostridium sp. X23]|uniref:GGDEF domain-containing protein n=1 Tax=Petroclostridium sp. X23 TaxID=3045146 RepID=UPI0024ADE5E4|nr:GGDEF domain-containing protein [Petroclostridium sp. X23]WHH57148.1 GGDEF domain-containing protein [Petroclostridium sp. X23]
MESEKEKDRIITYLAEFTDSNLEREYMNQEIEKAVKYIKPIVLTLGILYFLFLIPDYFLIKSGREFDFIVLNRISFMILVVILYIRIKTAQNYYALVYWITGYEFIVFLLFLMVFYQYETPNFLIQAFGVMVILLGVFMVPNRWIYMIIVSLFISAGFFLFSLFHLKYIKISELSAAIVYTLIVIALSSISAFRTNYLKRVQYISSQELKRMVMIDPLTGIYNRFKFNEELDKWINYTKRYNSNLSLIIFDLDDFKRINDSYGHLIGDQVILDIVKLVQHTIRETDIFARWGGEEFVILLPNTHKLDAANLSERIRLAVESHLFDSVGKVTCSFGAATFSFEEDAQSLLHRADSLLYKAKKQGKNTVMY